VKVTILGMVEYPDGSRREHRDEPPLEALARGPVWLVDEVGGRYEIGASAVLVGEIQLVLVDEASSTVREIRSRTSSATSS
jgi:hypothetical protein